jgi:hypothetical protein
MTATNGWQEIGTVKELTYETETETLHGFNGSKVIPTSRSVRLDFADGRTLYAPSATFKKVSDNEFEIVLDTYSFPQRYMLGTDQEQSLPFVHNNRRTYMNGQGRTIELGTNGYHPELAVAGSTRTVLKSEDIPQFAYELFANSGYTPRARINLPGGGTPFISVGTGDEQARINTPSNEKQAERNLNFAIANLKAYQQWVSVTKPAIERKKQEDLARLEAEAKAEAKAKAEKEAIEKKQAARSKAGLDLYNRTFGTTFSSWASAHLSLSTREEWADKAEEIANLKRKSDPFRITSSMINAGTISASNLRSSIFGF